MRISKPNIQSSLRTQLVTLLIHLFIYVHAYVSVSLLASYSGPLNKWEIDMWSSRCASCVGWRPGPVEASRWNWWCCAARREKRKQNTDVHAYAHECAQVRTRILSKALSKLCPFGHRSAIRACTGNTGKMVSSSRLKCMHILQVWYRWMISVLLEATSNLLEF